MWTTGTYDPELNLIFVGTGNPTPVLNGDARPGDNPWTCSIVALNPDTGKLAWGFQVSPHDTHDWDAAEVPVLVDGDFNGQPRKMLMQASRNGYFFVLDRTNGKSLLTKPFAAVNWAKGIDEHGRPIPESRQGAGKRRRPDRARTKPAPRTSVRRASIRRPGLLIVNAQDGYGIYFFKPEHGAYGWAGRTTIWPASLPARHRLQDGKDRLGSSHRRGAWNSGRADHGDRPDHHRRQPG